MPKPLSAILQVAVNPGCASGGSGEGGRTLSLWPPCPRGPCGVPVPEHSLAAGCLEQGPASGMWGRCMEAELMGLCVPMHDVVLEDGGCPWVGGGLEEGGLSHRESLQPGLGGVGGSFPRPLLEAPETC